MQVRVSMIMIPRLFILLVLFFTGCENVDESEKEKNRILTDPSISGSTIEEKLRFQSNDRSREEIIKDFPKPVNTYPLIDRSEIEVRNGGIIHRKEIDRPFTGRIFERYPDGSIALESYYLEGLPHGQQLRRFENGNPALEAIFDNGVLSGVKSKWWENGNIREEEYWSEGEFFGRRLWDENGRMIREELVPK